MHLSYFFFALLLIWLIADSTHFIDTLNQFNSWFLHHFGDWVVITSSGFFLLLIAIAISPLGNLKMGRDEDEPEYSTLSWLAMLFAAGIGSGLVFWSVAEPLHHYVQAPPLLSTSSDSQRLYNALMVTNIHWALHPWAIYGISALTVGYFSFRHHQPMLPSASALFFIKDNSKSRWLAEVIDLIGIAAVVFGLVATLGMGSLQMKRGLRDYFELAREGTPYLQQGLVILLTIAFIASSTTRLKYGIRLVSSFNMQLCFLFLAFVFFCSDSVTLLLIFLQSLFDYLGYFFFYPLELMNNSKAAHVKWQQDWTVSYLLWWVAWAPFVGVFVARISKGRKLREFIIGAVVLPALFSLLWFAVFGGSAILLDQQSSGVLSANIEQDFAAATYLLLDYFPFAPWTYGLVFLLMFFSIVTSADSGTYVLGMFSSGGVERPSIRVRFYWGIVLGLLAVVGVSSQLGVETLRAVSSVGAIPFLLILLLQVTVLIIKLSQELRYLKKNLSYS